MEKRGKTLNDEKLNAKDSVREERSHDTREVSSQVEDMERAEEGDEARTGEQGGPAPGEQTGQEEKVLTLEAQLNQAEAKAQEYYGHLQRLQAEFDNFRKRTQKEKEETVKYATEQIIASMLPVLDNLDRAITASRTNQDFTSFAKGVEMILRQMQNVLIKEGLCEIKALGEPFNPKLHEAVMQVESEGQVENTVVEELQKGYYLKDKVLRPSMVKVSH